MPESSTTLPSASPWEGSALREAPDALFSIWELYRAVLLGEISWVRWQQ